MLPTQSLTASDRSNESNDLFLGIDYVEFYVGNALQAAHYYQTTLGLVPTAYAGLETGVRDRTSFLLRREEINFVVTSPLENTGPIADYLAHHGDGVKNIAFQVRDVEQAYYQLLRHGAKPLQEPILSKSATGKIRRATVAVYGDMTHTLVEREGHLETPLPTFQPIAGKCVPDTYLHEFDHFAIGFQLGQVEDWANFYMRACGFEQLHEENIQTELSAMTSKALQNANGRIKFVLIEPRAGKRMSQIEEFLKYHHGPGVQHVGLHSSNIIGTVNQLKHNGIQFASAPTSYYEMLTERVGQISENLGDLHNANILVDRDELGYLLQIFSLPVQPRPTLFIEIIQRKNARGFGSGNIQALFKALEREQERRGNL